jgi:hypothetical protein
MVLDRSGSMESCRAATITSVNKYLLEARGDENLKEADFELMIFDTQSLDVIRSGRIADVKDIIEEDFQPRGGTPLLDAIGRGVDSLDRKTANDKAILVIVTDGEENSSKKHNYESIKALIDDRQAKGWLIVFLGAGLASAQQGLRMSIRAANVANIGLDDASLAASMGIMAAIAGAYASTNTAAEAGAYAASEKLTPNMRAMMGDASGGADLLDQDDDAKKKLKDAWATTLAERVPDDAFAKASGDAWGN